MLKDISIRLNGLMSGLSQFADLMESLSALARSLEMQLNDVIHDLSIHDDLSKGEPDGTDS